MLGGVMSWECLPMNQLFSLMDSFSIMEASALIAGKSPDSIVPEYDMNGNPCSEPCILDNASDYEKTVFRMAVNSITHAIEIGQLKALIKTRATTQLYKTDLAKDWEVKYFLSPNETRIERNELMKWLSSRNCYPDFFFNNSNTPMYLIPENNPQYSPKLCAIVHAWEATKEAEENNQLGGASVKQYASNWLDKNAPKYGVEGVSNYDDMAAIINWNTKGGRVSDKATHKNIKPSLPISNNIAFKSEGDNQNNVIDSLVIEKNDLEGNPYSYSSIRNDDDLPF